MTTDRVVFVHIPKTGGVTLSAVLRRHYGADKTLTLNTMRDPISSVADIPLEQRTQARLVNGHVHHGVAEFLPGPATHVTLLREPVSRVISLHRFVRTEPRHPLHERVIRDDVDLEGFVASGMDEFQVENGQVRQLAGVREGPVGRAELELAKRRLADDYLVVGLTMYFDETLVLLRRALGWRGPVLYVKRNVTRGNRAPAPPSALDEIRRRNALDIELRQFVRERLEAKLARTRFLAAEVAQIRLASRAATAVQQRRQGP